MDKQTLKIDFSTEWGRSRMHTQTYFHTKYESDANRKNDRVPLQVNCVGAVSEEACFSNRGARHDYYYIYVLEGKMITDTFTLLPGDVIVFEPGYTYQYLSEGKTSYLWVHYTGFEADSLTKSSSLAPNVRQHIGIREEIINCFQKLFREFMIHDEAAGQLSLCLLREILLFTGRYAGAGGRSSAPLSAMEYIHRHFQEPIDIDSLARLEHMSCTSLRSIFKQHTGVSPNEYIITQRVSAACQLLSQTHKSVSAVAADVGYHDQYYFSRIFKKKVGMSPLRYRALKGS